MKEVFLIIEKSYGVIGVARSITGVVCCLAADKWLTSEEIALILEDGKREEVVEDNLEEFGIFLEKKILW